MNVENISFFSDVLFRPEINKPEAAEKKESFASIYQAALDILQETNRYQHEADQAQLALATGKTDDILSVMLAQERAYSSLNFTVQVTNKIIESYREIMRMQV